MEENVLIILDHYDVDMFKINNRQVIPNFENSKVGKILKNKIINHPRTGLDTKGFNTKVKFYIPKVPNVNKQTEAYVMPPVAERNKCLDKIVEEIKSLEPKLVVCYGSWFANDLCKRLKVKKQTFELMNLSLDDFNTYYAFAPSLNIQGTMGSFDRDRLKIENRFINRYLKGGIKSLEPQFGKYEVIKDYNKVVDTFNYIKSLPKNKVVAVDFETNTLKTWLPGAKALMISLSWDEHQGVSIPISHKDEPNLWTDDEYNSLISMIKDLFMSDHYKVMHNANYDLQMLMDIYGLEYANNVMDTMLMYYELYDENSGVQRGLKHLAYMFTDMGGYENDRDVEMDKYLESKREAYYAIENAKYEAGERKKPTKTEYNPPKNEIDGEKFNFEWLPLDTIYKYASADTDVTLQLFHIFIERAKKNKKQLKLVIDFYPKLVETLAYIQHTGFTLDKDKLASYGEHFVKEQQNVVNQMYNEIPEVSEFEHERLEKVKEREKIKAIKKSDRTEEQNKFFSDYAKLSGKDKDGVERYKFNPGSKQHIGYILYEMMGYALPASKDYLSPKYAKYAKNPDKITWDMYKTDRNDALPYLKKEFNEPFVNMLLTYSDDKKMISSVVEGYGKLIGPNNLVHGKFLSAGTVTSRLASQNPKL